MDMIGLGGLLGLLGIWGRSKLTDRIDEIQGNVEKNSEQVESQVKNIEKIAADASRKVQDLSLTSKQYATKSDAEKILDRLVVVEKSEVAKKIPALEKRIDELQRILLDVLNVHTNFQKRIEKLERINYGEVLTGFEERINAVSASVETFSEHFDELETRIQSLEETMKNVMEGVDIMDGNVKNFGDDLQNLVVRVTTLETQPQDATSDGDIEKFAEQIAALEVSQRTLEGTLEDTQKNFAQNFTEFNKLLQDHRNVLVRWQNNFATIQNFMNSTQATFEEQKKFFADVQSKFAAQEKSFADVRAEVQNKFDAQEQSLGEVKAQLDAQSSVEPPAENLDAIEKSLGEVKAEVQSRFDAQEKSFEDVKAEVQSKFDAQEKSLGEIKTTVETQAGLIESVQKNISAFEKFFDTLKENDYLTIENFDIKPTGRVFFSNHPDEVFKNLKIATNLSGITSFLESSNYSKKESFIRIIENYRQNLKKVSDKMRRKKFNEDALSEEITEAFFNTLSKFFLATIPISIYRGARQETLDSFDDDTRAEESEFYLTFLKKINEYLAACHVYTVPISPKEPMTSNDIDRMSVTRKETANEAEDNVIDEVERLPYYMDYLTESGDVESFFSEGKMVVLKFDGGAQ